MNAVVRFPVSVALSSGTQVSPAQVFEHLEVGQPIAWNGVIIGSVKGKTMKGNELIIVYTLKDEWMINALSQTTLAIIEAKIDG